MSAAAGDGPVGGEGSVVGVGVDAVDVERLRALLARRPGLRRRLFTDAEVAYADRRRDPSEALAARFAAKEAVLKALSSGLGAARFADIEVVRAASGAPSVALHHTAAALAAAHGVTGWRLSLTHTTTVAVAVVVALGDGGSAGEAVPTWRG